MTFKAGLSLQEGLTKIGKVATEQRFEITPDSEFVNALKYRRDAGYISVPWEVPYQKWLELGVEELLLRIGLESGIVFDKFNVVFGPQIVSISVWEAVVNALEFGSCSLDEVGEKGTVSVTVHPGKKGVLVCIEDPGSGFNFEKLLTVPSQNYVGEEGIWRGDGLIRLSRERNVQAWFERIREGFRTNLLFVVSR